VVEVIPEPPVKQQQPTLVAAVVQVMEKLPSPLRLAALAAQASLSSAT
jgi:chaperone required for assembly of F1-ATPase